MAFIHVNGAQLYYETFGEDRSHRVPIILIHGSTGTGPSNWRYVAPLLAREYRVIVLDCRGHGRSSNPTHSYRFKEMADDIAALVRALGYERAHIIGHSNGGNVALVTLLAHPEIVQTAIPQAANAYVSPDLVEKEPGIFDPDRVAREAPHWMNEMIALHGETHGKDYWRDLLQLTVHEIITEPNYTPTDLARVQRPTLVIQGSNDRVNAPMRHAQFIAKHIPNAELWIPNGIGHTVHDELLFQWIEHVLDFLARRGDDANEALYRLQRAYYSDKRITIFDVKVHRSNSAISLSGQVLNAEQLHAATETLTPFAPRVDSSDLAILLTATTPYALVNRTVSDVRREPRRLSERMSQVRLGEVVRILEDKGEWARVRVEQDGYIGWMQTAGLFNCDEKIAHNYQTAANALVQGELVPAYLDPYRTEDVVGKLPFAVAVQITDDYDDSAAVRLPDGRVWWIEGGALLPLKQRPAQNPEGITFTLNLMRRFVGVPYLWGGRTPFGFDCSGLAQTFYGFLGIMLPRDADQQFLKGVSVEHAQPGDLLFFGEESEHAERFITHVAISLGGDDLIHANGTAGGVSYNSPDLAAPNFSAWLKENLAGIRRYI